MTTTPSKYEFIAVDGKSYIQECRDLKDIHDNCMRYGSVKYRPINPAHTAPMFKKEENHV
jgi:hypothetical protein